MDIKQHAMAKLSTVYANQRKHIKGDYFPSIYTDSLASIGVFHRENQFFASPVKFSKCGLSGSCPVATEYIR